MKCMTVNIKRRQEYFTRGSYGFLDVSPSGLFGIIAWPNCHVFIKVRSFNEYCDRKIHMLMIDVRKYSSERNMSGFHYGF